MRGALLEIPHAEADVVPATAEEEAELVGSWSMMATGTPAYVRSLSIGSKTTSTLPSALPRALLLVHVELRRRPVSRSME